MTKHTVIIDCSSILTACLRAGVAENAYQVEFGGKTQRINPADYGVRNALNSITSMMEFLGVTPYDLVFVVEGSDGARLRRSIYPGYKNRPPKPPEWDMELASMLATLEGCFRRLGSTFVTQDGVEADDVVSYLAKNLTGQRTVWMNDGDGHTLIGPEVHHFYKGQLITRAEFNPYGPFDVRFIPLYKALVGDDSDTVKGCPGFGQVAWEKLLTLLDDDGLEGLAGYIERRQLELLEEDVQYFKPFRKIIDNATEIYQSWRVVNLMPERVNTPRAPLTWRPGICLNFDRPVHLDDRLKAHAQQRWLVTSENFDKILSSESLFQSIATGRQPALDVETSTNEDSDDWLRSVNSQDEDDAPKGVDVMSSELTGLGLTYGPNANRTLYFSIGHLTDKNITPEQLFQFLDRVLQVNPNTRFTVHNSGFELPVLFNNLMQFTLGNPRWQRGFLPGVDDSMFMASYVDENVRLGLKDQAARLLDYQQETYDEVIARSEKAQRGEHAKMRDLTPEQVFSYGTDDTIVTAALATHYGRIMTLENTSSVYKRVEMGAAYLCAYGYVRGTAFSLEEMAAQERADAKRWDDAWTVLRDYLVSVKWDGVEMPTFDMASAADIKAAYFFATGTELDTRVRTPAKLFDLIEQAGQGTLAEFMRSGNAAALHKYLRTFHTGDPKINLNSPKQISKLLYETMALPIRSRNKPTPDMRKAGIHEGAPSTDALAIASALFYDAEERPELVPVINAIHTLRSVETLRKMYYRPYRHLRHPKTGRIHGNYGQCMTVTRRFAPSKPNLAQLPKDKGAFRRCFRPHRKGAVIVSLDFNAQELRVIADQSKDPLMLSCYVGPLAERKDLHHLTGLGIAIQKLKQEISYEEFAAALDDESDPMHKAYKGFRKKAKTVNFSTEYGAEEDTLAGTLMVPPEEARLYIDTKHATYARSETWKKDELIPEARRVGYSRTLMGGRRHLAEAYRGKSWEARRGDRQAVNYRIQGSCAEMTKQVMGAIWCSDILDRFDVAFFAPIHDELVFSVMLDELCDVVPLIHQHMVMPYADMEVPMESSVGIGLNFLDLIEIGIHPTPELLDKTARTLRERDPKWFEELELV
jgi:DNA polymerase I-like protein with 3'-5' exonuclease and polymerase domains/5'-3' exonuclease